ncbi:MAG: pyridoxal phosphate-dependent aminotransferase [Deferribacterales bacterium]
MRDKNSAFSQKLSNISESMSIYMNQVVTNERSKGRTITSLCVGDTFFKIPQINVSKEDFDRGCQYSDSRGLPELREKLSSYYEKYGVKTNPEKEILITAGSKAAIFFVFMSVLNDGDEVAIHEPLWVSYTEQAKLCGGKVRQIPFDTEIKDFTEYISDKTKILLINNPNNPAGRIYTKDELNTLLAICRKNGIILMADEAYSDFLREGFCSVGSLSDSKDNIVIVNSLSKNFGLSGWRLGFVIASEAMIENVLKLNQHIITCAPTSLQLYLCRNFDVIQADVAKQISATLDKREAVSRFMDEAGLKRMSGEATYYFMVNIGDFKGTSIEFAYLLLLKHNIAVIPGEAYGDSVSRFVRVSLGPYPANVIIDALRVLAECTKAEFDREDLHGQIRTEGYNI